MFFHNAMGILTKLSTKMIAFFVFRAERKKQKSEVLRSENFAFMFLHEES